MYTTLPKIQVFSWMIGILFLSSTIGLLVSFNNMSMNIYFLIVLLTLTLSTFISILFKHPPIVIQIIVLALSVRIIIFLYLKLHSYQLGLDGFFPGDVDAYAYHREALEAIRSASWIQALEGNLPYAHFVAFLYKTLGVDMIIPQLFNLGASVLVVPLLFELGRRINGVKAGVIASLLWSVFPSAIYWSVSLLKDSFLNLGMVLAAFLILGISQRKFNRIDIFLGFCGIILVSYMRPQFLLAIALPMLTIIGYQFLKGKTSFLRNMILILCCIGFFGAAASGEVIRDRLEDSTTTEGVEHTNDIALKGGSAIHFLTTVPAEVKWIAQLPFSILAPFPWQWFNFGQMIYFLTAFEMIGWYFIYVYMWKNKSWFLGNKTGLFLLIYAFSVFIAVSFSLPNLGSIYRYRLAALTLLLPLVYAKSAGRKSRKDENK
ncbi:hypothetical protein [Fictibacillus sp. UD]|uniref:hypothetical protein n=1 Tax=Fictibacillus sp. UD TaxID=3038777 RepID=UPI003748EBF4